MRLREFECLPEVMVRSRTGTEAKSAAIMSIQSHYVLLFWENSEIFLISIKNYIKQWAFTRTLSIHEDNVLRSH